MLGLLGTAPIEAAVAQTLGEMSLEVKSVDLQMDKEGPVAKGFTLRMPGNLGLAAARASKFMQLQRTGSSWRELTA